MALDLTPQAIARSIVAREGGFVNDPDDPGGATNFGVTIHTMRQLGLDLDHDGDVDVADVRMLTQDHAIEIFLDHYLHRPKIDQLPEMLIDTVFDMNVNAGANSVKILQRVLREFREQVSVDGALGPQSIGAAHRVAQSAGGFLRDAYGIARRNYYFSLADGRPASRKYCRTRAGGKGGWIHRAEEFISPRYHMSAAQFAERVSKWD